MKKGFAAMRESVRMSYNLDKRLPLYVLRFVFDATIPFIAIWLSAYILDGLTTAKGFLDLAPTALAGVGAAFALSIASAWINKMWRTRMWSMLMESRYMANDKNMGLDYQQLDDPDMVALREKMRNDGMWGSGIINTNWYLGDTVASIVRIALSIVTLAPLLSSPVFYSGGYSLLYLLLAAVATGGAILYNFKVLVPKMRSFEAETAQSGIAVIWRYVRGAFDYRYGKDIRIYDAKALLRRDIDEAMERFVGMSRGIANSTGIGGGLAGASEGAILGGAYLLVTVLALIGGLTVGAVVRSASGFFQLAQGLSKLFLTVSEFSTDAQRLQSTFAFLEVPNVLHRGTIPVEKRRDNEYEIEFHDVSFKYPGSDRWALRNLSLKLRVGEKLAVVGENGSGKTTMIKLLCRLYDPTEGEITLNGIDIRKYDQREYFGIFAVVFQDFRLLSLGLGQNVAASDTVDAARARECLIKAGFGERLDSLPDGLDTILYKDFTARGVEVSGGEAQKIALARALYKRAPFVVLDEPTAALDPIAEFDIYSRFDDIVDDRTAIYISHRLSSCRFCGDIAVFHEGRLIQRGGHDALLADSGGKYAALWHAQAQYYAREREA